MQNQTSNRNLTLWAIIILSLIAIGILSYYFLFKSYPIHEPVSVSSDSPTNQAQV